MSPLTTAERSLREVTERDFQRRVIDMARSLGWGVTLSARRAMLEEAANYGVEAPPLDGLVFHPHFSMGSEPGWPDLTLVRRRDCRLVFAELKAERGTVSVRQAEVLELLSFVAADMARVSDRPAPQVQVFVWRPSDLDQIAEVLR